MAATNIVSLCLNDVRPCFLFDKKKKKNVLSAETKVSAIIILSAGLLVAVMWR